VIVIADTSPVNYLLLIGRIELLARLYTVVSIPRAVHRELTDAGAPDVVRAWASELPAWICLEQAPAHPVDFEPSLDEGEREAIALGMLHLDSEEVLLLMDDWRGRQAAQQRNLAVTGTLGILREASIEGLVDLRQAIQDLRRTNFTMSAELVESILRSTR
jgi:predicted nucleic acid-binding protein